MFWYLTYPLAFENFIVLWYLTTTDVNRDSSPQKMQNWQLTWATDWKVQISHKIRTDAVTVGEGWDCWSRHKHSYSLASPLASSPSLPHPLSLFRSHLSSQGQILLWLMLPRRPEQVLGVTGRNLYDEFGGNLLMQKQPSVMPHSMLL